MPCPRSRPSPCFAPGLPMRSLTVHRHMLSASGFALRAGAGKARPLCAACRLAGKAVERVLRDKERGRKTEWFYAEQPVAGGGEEGYAARRPAPAGQEEASWRWGLWAKRIPGTDRFARRKGNSSRLLRSRPGRNMLPGTVGVRRRLRRSASTDGGKSFTT